MAHNQERIRDRGREVKRQREERKERREAIKRDRMNEQPVRYIKFLSYLLKLHTKS